MFYKVKTVRPLTPFSLLVSFDTGEKKRYDVAPLFDKWEAFKPLASVKGLFEQVKVDAGGYGISWNDDIDLSCNELWNNGVAVPDEQPNADTLAAMEEVQEMIKNNTGQHFTGSTADFFSM